MNDLTEIEGVGTVHVHSQEVIPSLRELMASHGTKDIERSFLRGLSLSQWNGMQSKALTLFEHKIPDRTSVIPEFTSGQVLGREAGTSIGFIDRGGEPYRQINPSDQDS